MSGEEHGGGGFFAAFKWIILAVIGIWILWYYTGGPERAMKNGDLPFMTAPAPIDTGEYFGPQDR